MNFAVVLANGCLARKDFAHPDQSVHGRIIDSCGLVAGGGPIVDGHPILLCSSVWAEVVLRMPRAVHKVMSPATTVATASSNRPQRYSWVAAHKPPNSRGGTKPPSPPAAPTKPVMEPTWCGSETWATRAKTAPAPNPKPMAMRRNATVPNPSSRGLVASDSAHTTTMT